MHWSGPSKCGTWLKDDLRTCLLIRDLLFRRSTDLFPVWIPSDHLAVVIRVSSRWWISTWIHKWHQLIKQILAKAEKPFFFPFYKQSRVAPRSIFHTFSTQGQRLQSAFIVFNPHVLNHTKSLRLATPKPFISHPSRWYFQLLFHLFFFFFAIKKCHKPW